MSDTDNTQEPSATPQDEKVIPQADQEEVRRIQVNVPQE